MLKVAIVDDHKLFRDSLTLLVSSFEDMKVLFDSGNGKELLHELTTHHLPDIVVLDIQMPLMDGYETCMALQKLYPHVKILILSERSDRESVHKALDCGAHGFLTKNSDHEQLQKAIMGVHKNGYYFDSEIGAVLHDIIVCDKKSIRPTDPLAQFSDRDFQLIKLVAAGLSNAEVAERLYINIRSVEAHRRRLMEKTDSKNFTKVILQAIKYHYLTVEDL